MAIYHQSVKPVQRSKGRSATAAAAYRSGERIACEREGRVHDYTRRSGVEHTELVGWSGSREQLWNAAEAAERRKDGTPAREYEVALPAELDRDGREQLARDYAGWLHDRHGVAVDIAIHDHDKDNPHAHLLTTTRQVAQGNALGDKAAVEWSPQKRKQHGLPNRKADLQEAREAWQDHANRALERDGHDVRIDHRSLADQRTAALERGDERQAEALDREPTQHMGPAAAALERDGIETERGIENREREARNEERQSLYDRARELGAQIGEQARELRDRMRAGLEAAQAKFDRWEQGTERAMERIQGREQAHDREQEIERKQEQERDGPELSL